MNRKYINTLIARPLGTNNNIKAELKVYIPDEDGSSQQVKAFWEEDTFTHYIAYGETLGVLAKKYGTTVEELVRLNNLKSKNHIRAGEKLRIPASCQPLPEDLVPYKKREPSKKGNYIVQKNDNLWDLAKKFNTTVDELARLNNIDAANLGNIYAEEKLSVPEMKDKNVFGTNFSQDNNIDSSAKYLGGAYYSRTNEKGETEIKWQDSNEQRYVDENGNTWDFFSMGAEKAVEVIGDKSIYERKEKEREKAARKAYYKRLREGESWDRQFTLWARGLGYNERIEKEKTDPFFKGLVLLVPPVSLVNSVKTLTTGSDIYENNADGLDYGLSVIDVTTFGLGEITKLPKTVKTINTTIDFTATLGSAVKTTVTEINKQDEKKK